MFYDLDRNHLIQNFQQQDLSQRVQVSVSSRQRTVLKEELKEESQVLVMLYLPCEMMKNVVLLVYIEG